ncbi:metallophosphoesterase [Microbulbifer litoralis]|uniref:metallophosphoesterase n=1 Tax=Microbulbifer litoralis TaxID=2933965 RepID=UPI002028736B|nr:metallophosphoesterase [Microbulbifer sp. GX H0434]
MSTLLRVGRNTSGRDLVVGDVHGHLSQLRRQLDTLDFDPAADRLFFVGDIVDRGPDGEALLAMVDQRTCFSVLGNHEAMMIAGYEDASAAELHRANGGDWFYRLPEARRRQCVTVARRWPWAIEVETGNGCTGLVHANVPDSNWNEVVRLLQAMDRRWRDGAPLTEHGVAFAAQRILWNRSLILRFYSEVLESGDNRQRLEDHLASGDGGREWVAPGPAELLAPFWITGIDAVCMGHTYVPTAIRVGKCHFLDSYRGEPGEALSLLCINR